MRTFPITGLNQANKTFDIDGDWEIYFQKGKGRALEIRNSTGNNGIYTVVNAAHAVGTTTIEVNEPILSTTVDGDIHWLMTAQLSTFQLGMTPLGGASGRAIIYESTQTITDTTAMVGNTIQNQNVAVLEEILCTMEIKSDLEELITFIETFKKIPITGYMGVLGKIVLRMDVDSTDFCLLVWETGQSIEINGTPSRAFLQVQQSKRNYDHGVAIYPGDAVMYSCPEDSIVLIPGDIIKHDNIYYKIIAIQHAFFNGNIIYRESGLMKIRSIPAIWQVTGLVASPNLDGKTALTWDEMDTDALKHYEVWESLYPIETENIIEIVQELDYTRIKLADAYVENKYKTGQMITITDRATDNIDMGVLEYRNDGYGKGEIRVSVLLDQSAPPGVVWNMKNHYLRDKTKSNSITLKNLIPNVPYYYLVRAVDVYGTIGKWSDEAVTGTKGPGTRKVEGLR